MFAARRFSARTLATSTAGPARESSFVRNWVKVPAAWPVIGITAGALVLSSYKIYQTFAGPDFHFNKAERSTLDYVENARDPNAAIKWGNGLLNKGPEFIREQMIKKE